MSFGMKSRGWRPRRKSWNNNWRPWLLNQASWLLLPFLLHLLLRAKHLATKWCLSSVTLELPCGSSCLLLLWIPHRIMCFTHQLPKIGNQEPQRSWSYMLVVKIIIVVRHFSWLMLVFSLSFSKKCNSFSWMVEGSCFLGPLIDAWFLPVNISPSLSWHCFVFPSESILFPAQPRTMNFVKFAQVWMLTI